MICPLCSSEGFTRLGEKAGWSMVRCLSCGVSYIDPFPSDEQLAEVYDEYGVNKKNIKNGPRKVRRFKRRLWPLTKLTKGRNFLDIGCNTGFAVEAARRLGCDALGIDLSREAIAIASDLYPECSFLNVQLEALPSRGKKFDIVVCSEVIEHIRDPHSFFEALNAVLNPGAVLYFTTPDAGHFKVPGNFMTWNDVSPPQHVVLYEKRSLTRLLNEHGFDVLLFFPMLKPNMRGIARRR